MPTDRHVARVWERSSTRVRRVRDHLSLSTRELTAILLAVAAVAAILAVLADITEDVGGRDGIALKDPHRLQFFVDHRSDALVQVARAFTNLGSVTVLIPLAVLFGLVLWYRGVPIALALSPLVSLAVTGAFVAVAKHAFARTRPPVPLHLVVEGDASFPSGHSADSAALYLTFALVLAAVLLRRPIARLLALGLAGLLVTGVGLSRLILGVHWPTDVLAGWSLGLCVSLIVTVLAVLVTRLRPADPDGETTGSRATHHVRRVLTASRARSPHPHHPVQPIHPLPGAVS